jgi:chitin synthase
MKIPPPLKTPTPYGGRLTWVLPGGNFLIAHIKDKTKIRHKKRWSQVISCFCFSFDFYVNLSVGYVYVLFTWLSFIW